MDTGSTASTVINRPDSLHLLNPDEKETLEASSELGGGFTRERRNSKSCLKINGESGASPVSGSASPARRRSVHFDSSPAATMEVPSSEADKAQRGCGALIGPAPYLLGKEVYVVGGVDNDTDDEGAEPSEEAKRLALARAMARRQSGQMHSPTTVDKFVLNS